MQRYKVHQASTVSLSTVERIYKRRGVTVEAPSYAERCLHGYKIVEKMRRVAPGYVMVPDTASASPHDINMEAGRAIVFRSIGTLDDDAIQRMKATPTDDKVPTKQTIRKGTRVTIDTLGLTGKVMRVTGTKAIVKLDTSFSGSGAVEVPFGRLSVIDPSTIAQTHPGG